MDLVTFRSPSANLRVAFPADKFGYVEGTEYEHDLHGRVMIDPETRKPLRKLKLRDHAQFGQKPNPPGALVLDRDKPEDARMIEDLLRHPQFQSLFFMDDVDTQQIADQLSGKVVLTVPRELTKQDRDLIESLGTYYTKSIPPKAFNAALAAFELALERFKFRGLISPPPDHARRLLLGRIRDLLVALETAGAWQAPEERDSRE